MCSLARLDGFKKWKRSFCKCVKSLKSGAALCAVGGGRRETAQRNQLGRSTPRNSKKIPGKRTVEKNAG